MSGPPSEIDLRAAGFDVGVDGGLRDELALRLLCAFVGVPVEKAPAGWKMHPNVSTRAAWGRVAEVIEQEVTRRLEGKS